jgi:hypothetical protein
MAVSQTGLPLMPRIKIHGVEVLPRRDRNGSSPALLFTRTKNSEMNRSHIRRPR